MSLLSVMATAAFASLIRPLIDEKDIFKAFRRKKKPDPTQPQGLIWRPEDGMYEPIYGTVGYDRVTNVSVIFGGNQLSVFVPEDRPRHLDDY